MSSSTAKGHNPLMKSAAIVISGGCGRLPHPPQSLAGGSGAAGMPRSRRFGSERAICQTFGLNPSSPQRLGTASSGGVALIGR